MSTSYFRSQFSSLIQSEHYILDQLWQNWDDGYKQVSADTIANDYNLNLADNGVSEVSGICQFICPPDMISDQVRVFENRSSVLLQCS